jgi:hypothetical protein
LNAVKNSILPEIDFLNANIVLPKIYKKTSEASLRNMTKIEADQIQEKLDNS